MLPIYVDVSRSLGSFEERLLTVSVFSSILRLFAGLELPQPSQAICVSARAVAFENQVLVALRCGMTGQDNTQKPLLRMSES